MSLELTVEQGTCPDNIISELMEDDTVTEYGVSLDKVNALLRNAEWRSHEDDLLFASRRAKGAEFVLVFNDYNGIYRKVFKNGQMRIQTPVITWSD